MSKMMDLEFLIECQKSEDIMEKSIYEFTINNMNINKVNSLLLESEASAYYEFNFDKLKTGFVNAVSTIYKALMKFFEDLKVEIEIMIEKKKLNDKLEEMKDILAKKRSKALNKKINYFDVVKYKEFYTDFINKYTTELKKGLNKTFRDADEYNEWKKSVERKLDEFNYKMTDTEQWTISVAVNNAIDLTKKELDNRNNNLSMVKKTGVSALKDIESLGKRYESKKLTIESSYVNYEPNHFSFLKTIYEKLSSIIKKIANFVMKHPIITISAIFLLIIN